MLDETYLAIIEILKKNARIQWREIGEQVHMTGQAVGNRIRRMEEMGLIKGYRIDVDELKLGNTLTAFVTIFMKTTAHREFVEFVTDNPQIIVADRISGDGCYILKIKAASHEELNALLDSFLKFGNYRVNLSLGHIK